MNKSLMMVHRLAMESIRVRNENFHSAIDTLNDLYVADSKEEKARLQRQYEVIREWGNELEKIVQLSENLLREIENELGIRKPNKSTTNY